MQYTRYTTVLVSVAIVSVTLTTTPQFKKLHSFLREHGVEGGREGGREGERTMGV